MDEKIIDILKNVEGISTSDGLKYCGSETSYVKFINSFFSSIEKKASDIQDAYDKEDYDLYTIRVHALKSVARIAGIGNLSELALKLEEAGESQNISFIKENTGELLSLLRSYGERLSFLDEMAAKGCESGKPISEKDLKEAYRALAEYIPMMDYDAVEVILSEVEKFSMPESDAHLLGTLDKLLRNFEWDEMEKLIKSVT